MAKPITSALAKRLASIAAIKVERLNQLIEARNYQAAVHAIDDINAEALGVSGSCQHLANTIRGRFWNPLFDERGGQADG
jgi:hypothetical protein